MGAQSTLSIGVGCPTSGPPHLSHCNIKKDRFFRQFFTGTEGDGEGEGEGQGHSIFLRTVLHQTIGLSTVSFRGGCPLNPSSGIYISGCCPSVFCIFHFCFFPLCKSSSRFFCQIFHLFLLFLVFLHPAPPTIARVEWAPSL